MNATQLLAHFDRLAEAPNAVPRLRRFILDLAVRGKLVEQDAGDEPAAELLKRLTSHMKKPTKNYSAAANPAPSKHPVGWVFARFSDVLTLEYGDNLPAEKRSNSGEFPVYGSNGVVGSHDEAFVHEPCIVVGRKGSAGALNLCASKDSCVTDVAYYCVPPIGLDLQYTFKMFHTIGLDILSKGIKPGLSRAEAYELWVPIPPLAEQHRIVAKVDELMALCDQLEAAQQERERRRDRLATASLQRLNQPAADTTSEAQRENARFHLHHLPHLTTRPEHIKAMRQTVLDLAVRGKLVPQDSSNESAQKCLLENDATRKGVASSDRRADIDAQQLLEHELCWDVPTTWAWRGLADLALFIDYRGQTPNKVEAGVRLITAKNVKPGFINLHPEEFLTEPAYDDWMTRGFPKIGDVLFTTEAPMGNAAVVKLPERFALAQRVINFRLYGAIDPHFLVLQLISQSFQRILDKTATGLTAKGIKAAKLKRLPITVPPLAEQQRIVAKVDELMALCDQIEAQLTATQTDSRRLLEAVLEAALAGNSMASG